MKFLKKKIKENSTNSNMSRDKFDVGDYVHHRDGVAGTMCINQ